MTDNSEPTAATARRRLHPLSPLLRGLRSLWLVIAALSWQGFARFGISGGAIIVGCGGLLVLAWSWVTWYFTGIEVVSRELRIHEGVLVRRNRTIPLERLQTVEVVQPLLARAVGLAELRLEVVGATKTEAPLAFLTLSEARELRTRLLELSRHASAPAEALAPEAELTPTNPTAEDIDAVATVSSRRLLLSQLLTPQVFFLPIAVMFTIGAFVLRPDATFYGIAGLITATLGITFKPVREAMINYDFTLRDTHDGLRIKRGLTEKRTQTIPTERVSAVVLRWPLLWRGAGWVSASVTHAGNGPASTEGVTGGTLLPVGTLRQAQRVTVTALSGVDVLDSRPVAPPRRARWLAPLSASIQGASLEPEIFVCRRGLLTRTLIAVPYARIQSVRVVQNRRQRWLRLATVHLDIVGGAMLAPHAAHREVGEALAIADSLRQRAHQQAARNGDAGAHRDPQ